MKKGWKILGGVTIGVVAVAGVPFTGGGSLFAGAAALGLGTAAAAGSAVAAGAAGGVLASGVLTPKKTPKVKKGIFILGPQQVGKTTIYKYLQGNNSTSEQTSVNNYEEFIYKIDTDKSLIIRKGKDIGGGEEYIRFYEKMIKDKEGDYGFFVFNAYNYIHDIEDHRGDVNARLDFIFEKKILNKNTIIIGSFIDQFDEKERASVFEKIKKMTEDKPYSILLSGEYFHLLNLKDSDSLKGFFKKIFKI